MARGVLYLFCILFIGVGVAQENPSLRKYAELINPEQLKDNLTILASDAMEGRYTGSRGQKLAAAFISNFFEEIGLEPPANGSYYQPVQLYSIKQENVFVEVGSTRFENLTDLFYSGSGETGSIVKSELVYVGRGRDEDLAQVNVSGKAALVLIDNLTMANAQELQAKAIKIREIGAKYIFGVSGSTPAEFDQTLARVKGRNTRGTIALAKPDPSKGMEGIIYLRPSVVEKIFNASIDKIKSIGSTQPSKKPLKGIKPATISFQVAVSVTPIRSENVLGYLPGTDKKDELVVITSHFDHLGKRSTGTGDLISNGADDDGSGTVALMQLAKTFVEAKKSGAVLRRSILFMAFTAEEQGKLGSEFYVNNPVFPLANTVVNLNIDMIGRADEKHRDNKNYVYVIGADKLSSELQEISERTNRTYTNLTFDYTYNDEGHPDRIYYRSDHWNFAKNNIPIIFYFNGTHEDYHKVTDEIGKIDFDLLATRAQCVFYTSWEIINREERLKVDKQ